MAKKIVRVRKIYKLYGREEGQKRWKFIAVRSGRSISSAKRTFKKRSGWDEVKVVRVRKKKKVIRVKKKR